MNINAPPENRDHGRAARMSLLARATLEELEQTIAPLASAADVKPLRGPETGLLMLRGRIGGGGNAFNLGEATVTRASVQLASGEIGHGQRLGTDADAVRYSAIVDALAETGRHDAKILALLDAVARRLEQEQQQLDAETQATRVDFFTLVRGEDQ